MHLTKFSKEFFDPSNPNISWENFLVRNGLIVFRCIQIFLEIKKDLLLFCMVNVLTTFFPPDWADAQKG